MNYLDELLAELNRPLSEEEKACTGDGPWSEQYEDKLEQQDKYEL